MYVTVVHLDFTWVKFLGQGRRSKFMIGLGLGTNSQQEKCTSPGETKADELFETVIRGLSNSGTH